MSHKFVGLPPKNGKVFLYRYSESEDKLKKARQVLWGDYLRLERNPVYPQIAKDHYIAIRWAPRDNGGEVLYIKSKHVADKRPLEMIFLDVGQGDGAILITPERDNNERIMVIDAGKGENMHKFLVGRFTQYVDEFNFHAAIITHPDNDHYLGFDPIFKDHKIGFEKIYFNGLVERPVRGTFEKVGGYKEDPITKIKYISSLAMDSNDIRNLFSDNSNFGQFEYPPVMHAALNNPKIKDFQMLSTHDGHSVKENDVMYLKDFAPSDNRAYTIQVLGPVAEYDTSGNIRLRRLGKYGETKNGHSIILRLEYKNYKILFGGDLNVKAEKFLLKHYTGLTSFPKKGSKKSEEMIEKAKAIFSSDVMKVCHHGASDVTDEFMQAVHPGCFVISSGDTEGHVHPRPDLLGRLGKNGKGESPVLLSTELQRSTREKEDEKLLTKLNKKILNIPKNPSDSWKEKLTDQIKTLSKTNVDVYGSIYVKTDGERLITAFKKETNSKTDKWFYFEYKIDDNGEFELC